MTETRSWSISERTTMDAWCDVIGCEWECKLPVGIREAARDHTLGTGHVTHVRVSEISTYERGSE